VTSGWFFIRQQKVMSVLNIHDHALTWFDMEMKATNT